jgi:hypothetical protein
MTPEQILKSQNIFLQNAEIDGFSVSIGYIKEFRWAWLATQMNTFVFISDYTDIISRDVIEHYSKACFEYALKNNKGRPRGWQSGVSSLAILRGNNIENGAVDFCERTMKKHWSAFEIPVLFSPDKKRLIKCLNEPLWGKLYLSYFSDLIARIEKIL